VLYTDGVVEAYGNSGEEFGETRLVETVFKNKHLSARGLTEAIVNQVADFSEGQQFDDITVVVTKIIA
jgi:sigma-B regulation protein RsbU (phosphoserine phosphatase)